MTQWQCWACGHSIMSCVCDSLRTMTIDEVKARARLRDAVALAMLHLTDDEIRQYVDATIDVVHAARAGVHEPPSR